MSEASRGESFEVGAIARTCESKPNSGCFVCGGPHYRRNCFFVLFAIFILHSRESELYRYTLDGKSALAWELPFTRFMSHLSST